MFEYKHIRALVMVAILCSFPCTIDAAISLSGVLNVTYPTWNRVSDRPDGTGGYLDSANDNLPYEVLEIRTTVAGDTLTASITGGTQFDSFLALYSQFNPATPLANILAADDDSGGYPNALLTKTGLAANTSYFLAISSYANTTNSVYPLYGNYGLTLGGSFAVVPKVTTTSVSASPNPSAYGHQLTLTATVAKSSYIAVPTGTVTFFDGGTPLGTGTLSTSSQATLTTSSLTSGSHSITASYVGEPRYLASASALLPVTVTPPPTISVTFAGNGGGTVISTAPDTAINCTKGSSSGCSASYTAGTPVTIAATADWKSIFTGWSNGVISSANPVTLPLNADMTVTAAFDPNYKARVMPGGALFASIQDAYASVASGSMTIQAQVWYFLEDLLFNNGTTVTLTGGMDASYKPTSGYSTVNGLTVETGSAVIGNIIIK